MSRDFILYEFSLTFDRDYKKLTFYFYAEQYVNFNDLVSDLFKVWKLRIWLSAVNPNSYPPPPAGGRRGRGHAEGLGFHEMRYCCIVDSNTR